jgi:hypothetical protein
MLVTLWGFLTPCLLCVHVPHDTHWINYSSRIVINTTCLFGGAGTMLTADAARPICDVSAGSTLASLHHHIFMPSSHLSNFAYPHATNRDREFYAPGLEWAWSLFALFLLRVLRWTHAYNLRGSGYSPGTRYNCNSLPFGRISICTYVTRVHTRNLRNWTSHTIYPIMINHHA